MSAGKINGSAVLWAAISTDFGERGQPARYRRIDRGVLKIASNAATNVSHFEMSSFAFTADDTLKFGADDVGLWFKAIVPETWTGFGVRNGLTGGRCIGASVEFDEMVMRYDAATGVEVVTSGRVVGVAFSAFARRMIAARGPAPPPVAAALSEMELVFEEMLSLAKN